MSTTTDSLLRRKKKRAPGKGDMHIKGEYEGGLVYIYSEDAVAYADSGVVKVLITPDGDLLSTSKRIFIGKDPDNPNTQGS
jgi:hypothetical protein